MVNPAYIMLSTAGKIVENFLYLTIFSIVGKPNYKTISEVHFKCNTNSTSFQSNLVDRYLGLLYLTVYPAVYNTLSTTVFIPLVNPGATAIITSGAATAVIASKRGSFADATALFKQYNSANKVFKQILLGALDEIFVRSLETKYVGYLNVSTHDILNHLYYEYARISLANLQNNDVALKTA